MEIIINGEKTEVNTNNLSEILKKQGYVENNFAVAVNMEHIPRSICNQVTISPGDRIEILTPRQGG